MVSTLLDHTGKQIVLDQELGKGGEGAVFTIRSQNHLVAKVYNKPVDQEKADKLREMLRLPGKDLNGYAAWPLATLHRTTGDKPVGIIIRRIDSAREIHEVYGPAHRNRYFPKADWAFLVHVARNCAAAFSGLHLREIVIGDVNQGNFFVDARAIVSLIDCDSFQIKADRHVFKCKVGVDRFTPPELQNVKFSDVVRTANHDNFGLAVLVFHLLFMGRHPFAGRFLGSGEMPIDRAIKECRFAYARSNTHTQMAPPPDSLTLSDIPSFMADLFENAFSVDATRLNSRPSALDWANSLTALTKKIVSCSRDPGHRHFAGSQCPWCRIQANGGPNFFISISWAVSTRLGNSFNLNEVIAAIELVPIPTFGGKVPNPLVTSNVKPRPLPDDMNSNRTPKRIVGGIAVFAAAISVLAFVWSTIGLFTFPLIVVFSAWWLILVSQDPVAGESRERCNRLQGCAEKLSVLSKRTSEIEENCKRTFTTAREDLRKLANDHRSLQTQHDRELSQLQSTLRERQLDDFLKHQFISNAKINGIGQTRLSTLGSYGIETAYDINSTSVYAVPGFGQTLCMALLLWRAGREREFRFDPTKGLPQSTTQALAMKYSQMRFSVEQKLLAGPSQLRRISDDANVRLKQAMEAMYRQEYEVAQAQADYDFVGTSPTYAKFTPEMLISRIRGLLKL